jgi:quinolinate synthetase A subunit
LRAWKAEYPGAVVVSVRNNNGCGGAESDYCCTSGNAVEVVNRFPPTRILFLPDMFLGAHVRRLTGRKNMHVWMGECHVHAGIDPEHIRLQRSLHPQAEFLIHPECGCSTSVLEAMSAGEVDAQGVQILSTEGMIKRPGQSDADEFIVATEVGILHRLRRENPSKRFVAANDRASCAYMKVTTLPKVLAALEHNQHRITVPAGIADRARRAIERMVAIGGGDKQHLSQTEVDRGITEATSPGNARDAPRAPFGPPHDHALFCRGDERQGMLRFPFKLEELDRIVRTALQEDGACNDLTTMATVVSDRRSRATLVARGKGVVCGVPLALNAFRILDAKVSIRVEHEDGACVTAGEPVLFVTGHARGLLSAERVALNYMQRLSGIASSRRYVRRCGAPPRRFSTRERRRPAGASSRNTRSVPAAGRTIAWICRAAC